MLLQYSGPASGLIWILNGSDLKILHIRLCFAVALWLRYRFLAALTLAGMVIVMYIH